jgi:hypothetical protein
MSYPFRHSAAGVVEGEGDPLAGELDLNGDGAPDLVGGAWIPTTADGECWLMYGAP